MDLSVFDVNKVLIVNSFCNIVSRGVKLLCTKKIRFKLFLCIRNMNDKKLVFGNYSYILENRTFLRNFVFLVVLWWSCWKWTWNFDDLVENEHETLMILLKMNMKHWIKSSEIFIDIFLCECIFRNKFCACTN